MLFVGYICVYHKMLRLLGPLRDEVSEFFGCNAIRNYSHSQTKLLSVHMQWFQTISDWITHVLCVVVVAGSGVAEKRDDTYLVGQAYFGLKYRSQAKLEMKVPVCDVCVCVVVLFLVLVRFFRALRHSTLYVYSRHQERTVIVILELSESHLP